MSNPREEILQRIEEAMAGRRALGHPGSFPVPDPGSREGLPPIELFKKVLERAGGEAMVFSGPEEASSWFQGFVVKFESAVFGETVPESLRLGVEIGVGFGVDLGVEEKDPTEAVLGVSMARCAIAETGSLVLDARDGRRTQLLPPVHLVWVRAGTVYGTALECLQALSGEPLPSALGLHSGPSKSADIGQIMVQGIHGPGRLIAGIVG